jgi:RNA polymerase sigma factor (sigma-70 family)
LTNPARLPAFVHSVCHNVALEMIRSKTRYRQMPETAEDPRDPAADPHDAVVTRERRQLVREILARLPKKDRDLLRLAMLEEVEKEELCRRFQVTEGYLRLLLYRARARFRAELLSRTRQPARTASRRQPGQPACTLAGSSGSLLS